MATTRCNKTYFIAGGRVERICGEVAEFICAECGKARCEEHSDESFEEVGGRLLCEDCLPVDAVATICLCGAPMKDGVCSVEGCVCSSKVALAREAIKAGKTMGQFLRELPDSDKMTPAELQEYGRAYAVARRP